MPQACIAKQLLVVYESKAMYLAAESILNDAGCPAVSTPSRSPSLGNP
ncbi:MAG: hypothetical protein K0R03_2207 [Moraxellaceae bacterium]|jgi:hypothetical protein|nr:hypothetical protein [Moraxellaceae bacterium]